MKILVIGNGFDLAHYLPTSYNHFMGVMQAIENLSVDTKNIDFDDLFGDLARKEEWFFDQTQELYAVDSISFDVHRVNDIQAKLVNNSWYAYFKKHLTEIETWIDFETKIGEALEVFSNLCNAFYEKKKEKASGFDSLIVNVSTHKGIYLGERDVACLIAFKIISATTSAYKSGFSLKREYEDTSYKELKFDRVLRDLMNDLDVFIEIFDTYLSTIIAGFKLKKPFSSFGKVLDNVEFIYSFNYTSTFLNLYPHYQDKVKIEYLHGQAGKSKKKLVLGISELPSEILKQHKAYGFVKYHQKLFNNTDYKFLKGNTQLESELERAGLGARETVEIYIWGHSLDVSDREYIEEIFSSEFEGYRGKIRVIILYHNDSSRFSMLANLLHILGKELVERWMKKDWLIFQQAPDIFIENTKYY